MTFRITRDPPKTKTDLLAAVRDRGQRNTGDRSFAWANFTVRLSIDPKQHVPLAESPTLSGWSHDVGHAEGFFYDPTRETSQKLQNFSMTGSFLSSTAAIPRLDRCHQFYGA
jgi:hypothetical protein